MQVNWNGEKSEKALRDNLRIKLKQQEPVTASPPPYAPLRTAFQVPSQRFNLLLQRLSFPWSRSNQVPTGQTSQHLERIRRYSVLIAARNSVFCCSLTYLAQAGGRPTRRLVTTLDRGFWVVTPCALEHTTSQPRMPRQTSPTNSRQNLRTSVATGNYKDLKDPVIVLKLNSINWIFVRSA
jgi:hypothetical protein